VIRSLRRLLRIVVTAALIIAAAPVSLVARGSVALAWRAGSTGRAVLPADARGVAGGHPLGRPGGRRAVPRLAGHVAPRRRRLLRRRGDLVTGAVIRAAGHPARPIAAIPTPGCAHTR
jgi:hypothetical protein